MADPTLGSGSSIAWSEVTQSGYCSFADLQKKIGKKKLSELTNDAFTQGIPNPSDAGGDPDPDVTQALIDEADSMIDSKAGLRYTVPFTTVPDDIKYLSINIACYLAFMRKGGANAITKEWKAIFENAMSDLNGIADGSIFIDVAAVSVSGEVVAETDERLVQFNDTDNQMSNF